MIRLVDLAGVAIVSKYSIAKEVMEDMTRQSNDNGSDLFELQANVLSKIVHSLAASRGKKSVESMLRYELDSLGSGDVYEIQRGGGHS